MKAQIIESYYFGMPDDLKKNISPEGFVPHRYLLDMLSVYNRDELDLLGKELIRPKELGVKLYNNGWNKVSEGLPEDSVEVLGYSEQWICEDYNLNGTRICFYNDPDWNSAKWCNSCDSYESCDTPPTHWREVYSDKKPIR